MKVIKERKWKYWGALKNAIIRHLKANKGADELDVADAMRICLQRSCEVLDEMVAEGWIRRSRPKGYTQNAPSAHWKKTT